MITIAWYNVVAIIVLILWLFWASNGKDDAFGLGAVVKLVAGIIFILFWGGMFWCGSNIPTMEGSQDWSLF